MKPIQGGIMSFAFAACVVLGVGLGMHFGTVSLVNAMSVHVADFRDDFQPGGFPTGWRYQWNANGAIGTTANYEDLSANAASYDTNGAAAGNALNITSLGGRPGAGTSDPTSGGIERFAIASYEIGAGEAGDYFISLAAGSNIRSPVANGDGISAKVFVNDTLVLDLGGAVNPQLLLATTQSLGSLTVGDIVYTAIGSRDFDVRDDFTMDINLVNVSGGAVKADFQDDFQASTFPTNWKYVWNAPDGWSPTDAGNGTTNPLGTAANYVPLVADGDRWTVDGDGISSSAPPENFLTILSNGGHPGGGANDNVGNNTLNRYAIASYTIDENGNYDLFGALGRRNLPQSSGDPETIDLHVLINDTLNSSFSGVTSEAFHESLGNLLAGDTVYLAVGAGSEGRDLSDGFRWDVTLVHSQLTNDPDPDPPTNDPGPDPPTNDPGPDPPTNDPGPDPPTITGPVFGTDFNAGVPPEFTGITTTEGVQEFDGLGTGSTVFGGDFLRNTSGDNFGGGALPSNTTLTLTELPDHTTISLGFLLAIVDSWEGNDCLDSSGMPGTDTLNVTVDGLLIFSEVFENSGCGTQTYVPPAGVELSRKGQLGFDPDNQFHLDSAYDMGLDPTFNDIPHTSSTLTIEWFASGDGWEGNTDESWAIDNVAVILDPMATPILDHFKCYKVQGDSVEITVDLEEQFETASDVKVGNPKRFCVPVDKNGEGITDPSTHLACYRLKGEELNREVVIENQFGTQTWEIKEPKYLCVPSSEKIMQE